MTEQYGVVYACSELHNCTRHHPDTDIHWGPVQFFKDSKEVGMICIPCSGRPTFETGDMRERFNEIHLIPKNRVHLITDRVADPVCPNNFNHGG